MKLWSQRLEENYKSELENSYSNLFEQSLEHLGRFYQDSNYHPYKIDGYSPQLTIQGAQASILGQHQLLGRSEPNRKANRVEAKVADCRLSRVGCSGSDKARVYFDFTTPHQLEAAMHCSLIVFLVFMMAYTAYDIHSTMGNMLVQPLERMLSVVTSHAKDIVDQFTAAAGVLDDTEEVQVDELEMLEAVLGKLARIASLHMKKNVISDTEFKNLDKSDQAIMEIMNVEVQDNGAASSRKPADMPVRRVSLTMPPIQPMCIVMQNRPKAAV